MQVVLTALVPVLILILLGYVLRRMDFPGDAFWKPAARAVYFIFLPALLVRVIAETELDPSLWRAQAALCMTVVVLVLLLLLSRKLVSRRDGPAFTSVMQGAVRHNTYVGLAIAGVLFGERGLAAFALLVAVVVPLVNAVSVLTLSRYGRGHAAKLGKMLRMVATNPLIIACALGALLNLTGIGLPFGTDRWLDLIGQPALPIGLLVVGAGLQASALVQVSRNVWIPTLARLVLYPLLAVGFGALFAVEQAHWGPMILLGALPTAASSYVLALELGGDTDLMARIITVETIVAALTLPAVLHYLA